MKPIERFEEYTMNSLDQVLVYIKNGQIKAGRLSFKIKNQTNKKSLKELIESVNRECEQ